MIMKNRVASQERQAASITCMSLSMGAGHIVRMGQISRGDHYSTTTSATYGPRFVAQPDESRTVPTDPLVTGPRGLKSALTSWWHTLLTEHPNVTLVGCQIIRILPCMGANSLPIAWVDQRLRRIHQWMMHSTAMADDWTRWLAKPRIYTAFAVSSICSRAEAGKQDTKHGKGSKASMSFRWYCPDQVL